MNNNKYKNKEYNDSKRIYSYAHQVAAIVDLGGRKVLEIGPGSGVVTKMLQQINVSVTTLDFDRNVEADIYANLMNLPFGIDSFDVILCCQVLEHLPFDKFPEALKIFRKTAQFATVVSIPDSSRHIDFELNLPIIGKFKKSLDYTRRELIPSSRLNDIGHYWEIGYKTTSLSTVVQKIEESGWTIQKTWRVAEIPWHRFFVLI